MTRADCQTDREASRRLLGDFDARSSAAWQVLMKMTRGASLVKHNLTKLVMLMSDVSGIRLPRDFTRRSDLMVKWIDMNLAKLEPLTTVFEVSGIKLLESKHQMDRPPTQ
jgi:hypothetical protein